MIKHEKQTQTEDSRISSLNSNNNNNSNNSVLGAGETSDHGCAQNPNRTEFTPNLGELVKNLKTFAKQSDINHTIQLLNQNKVIITQLKDNYPAIIEHFYPPYSIAYKQKNFEFCYEYGMTLDQLTGVSGILFMDEYQ